MPYEYKEFYEEVVVPAGYEDVRMDVDKCDTLCKLFEHWYTERLENLGTDSSSDKLWTIVKALKPLGFDPFNTAVSIESFIHEVVEGLMMYQAAEALSKDEAPPSNVLDIYPYTSAKVHCHDKGQECGPFCSQYRVDVTAVLKARP